MRYKITIIILFVLLSACSKTIEQDMIKKLIEHCDDKGGIYSIYIADTNEKFANCKDGSRTLIRRNIN